MKLAELFKYTAARFGGYGWREYDLQFRMCQELQPTRSWASVDVELWLMTAATRFNTTFAGESRAPSDSTDGAFDL